MFKLSQRLQLKFISIIRELYRLHTSEEDNTMGSELWFRIQITPSVIHRLCPTELSTQITSAQTWYFTFINLNLVLCYVCTRKASQLLDILTAVFSFIAENVTRASLIIWCAGSRATGTRLYTTADAGGFCTINRAKINPPLSVWYTLRCSFSYAQHL